MLTDDLRQELIRQAAAVQDQAYAPYSGYAVGAALLTASGQTFTGVNVENAVYPLTICAERAAVFSAVSAGQRDFQAVAVVTRDGGSPCGACRQVLSEFGLDTIVIVADESGRIHLETTVAGLLPHAFGSTNLKAG